MVQVWAHRGASGHAPENTLEAFSLAVAMGADGVELDVQLSSDGIPVVIHDETLERTTSLTGLVKDRSVAELARCDAGNGNYVPTLEEVLTLLAPSNLEVNIELKNSEITYPGLEQKTLDVVKVCGFADRVWYSSFQHYSLSQLRQIAPDARIGLLYCEALIDPWLYAQHCGADALHPDWRTLTIPGVLEGCKDAGVRVHTWTINQGEVVQQLAAVDAIITNFPEIAATVSR
ncbi:MAG: glycerophosphodiester phosphodiesterase [Propionibacteriaceae bacterium]